MGYPTQQGIDAYNLSNDTDFNKKSMSLMDKLNISEWLLSNGKPKLVVNPYSSVSLNIYTGTVAKVASRSERKKQEKNSLMTMGRRKRWMTLEENLRNVRNQKTNTETHGLKLKS
jgi:hypothetical protein